MIDCQHLREYVIYPSLTPLDLSSINAEELLVATVAQESTGGLYLHQNDGGPALGIYQMEPKTHAYLWNTYLTEIDKNEKDNNNPNINILGARIPNSFGYAILKTCKYTSIPDPFCMVYNLWYATIMARVFYYFIDAPLPHHDDLDAIWDYYKLHWNTPKGKATKQEFTIKYQRYIKGIL